MSKIKAPNGVTLLAVLSKVSTTPDGGWRLTFDVSANEDEQVLGMIDLRDRLAQMALVPVPAEVL